MARRVWILGSSNVDYTYRVKSLPVTGQTVNAEGYHTATGGKGANQAVAATHWGAQVYFIGAVGDDQNGKTLRNVLSSHGINSEKVTVLKGTASGNAIVQVDENGENYITVYGGANLLVPPPGSGSFDDFRTNDILVSQLEVNADAIAGYYEVAKNQCVYTVLNPSPYKSISRSILKMVDLLVANETEASEIGESQVDSAESAKTCALKIRNSVGIDAIVITLGSHGAVLSNREVCFHFPGYSVDVTDTQGAGDAFLGSLVAKLALNSNLEIAVCFANWVAAQSVAKHGSTQLSLPSQELAEKARFGEYCEI